MACEPILIYIHERKRFWSLISQMRERVLSISISKIKTISYHIISYHSVICVRVCIASMKIMGKVRSWSQIPTKISKTTQGLLNHAKDEPTKIRGRHDDSQSSLLPFVETTEPAVAGGEGREVIPLLPFQRGSAPQNSLRIPWQYDVLLVLWSHPLPLLSDGGRV